MKNDKYDIENETAGTILKGQRRYMMKLLADKEYFEPYAPAAPGFPNAEADGRTNGIIQMYNRLMNVPGAKDAAEMMDGGGKKHPIYKLIGLRFGRSPSSIHRILGKAGVIQHKRK